MPEHRKLAAELLEPGAGGHEQDEVETRRALDRRADRVSYFGDVILLSRAAPIG